MLSLKNTFRHRHQWRKKKKRERKEYWLILNVYEGRFVGGMKKR